LLIIDYEDVVEYPLAEADVREFVFNSGIIEYSSKDFVADWNELSAWLAAAMSACKITVSRLSLTRGALGEQRWRSIRR
jgi:hypothetical protein